MMHLDLSGANAHRRPRSPGVGSDRLAALPHWDEADSPAERAMDEAFKRELLREAAEWDDLNDRIASINDDTEG
jgi:hypothetical protein